MATLSVLTIAADYLGKSPPISLITDIFGFSIGDSFGTLSLKGKLESIVSGGDVDVGGGEDEPPPPMEEYEWYGSVDPNYALHTELMLNDLGWVNVYIVTQGFFSYLVVAAYQDQVFLVGTNVGETAGYGSTSGSNVQELRVKESYCGASGICKVRVYIQ